jgi:GT2 family glycosyltransferase
MISPIGVVIVTYNRKEKLKKALKAYDQQIFLPCEIIVVNNASTDGTNEILDRWKSENSIYSKVVIDSKYNVGGSGGFYLGEKRALHDNISWIMIADDDAYPDTDYIKKIYAYINSYKDKEPISIVSGKVIENGDIINIHRSFWRSQWDRNFHRPASRTDYNDIFYPDFASYVGIIINGKFLKKAGLVDKDLFMWCDDTEHTFRLGRFGKIVCIPDTSIYHDVSESNKSISWKTYYGYRNDLLFFKRHFPTHFPVIVLKLLCKTLLCPLKGKTFTEMKIRIVAIKDACLDNKGVHNMYKPGWKP